MQCGLSGKIREDFEMNQKIAGWKKKNIAGCFQWKIYVVCSTPFWVI